MPSDIVEDVLEQSVCQMFSLTGISLEPDNLQACHHTRKKYWVIKFKRRKQKHCLLSNRKTLQNKSLCLTELKFSRNLFVNESMCHENNQFVYKFRQLKSVCKIHSKCFYTSTFHIKLVENMENKLIYEIRYFIQRI